MSREIQQAVANLLGGVQVESAIDGMCEVCGVLVARGEEHHHAPEDDPLPSMHPMWAYLFAGQCPSDRAKGYAVH